MSEPTRLKKIKVPTEPGTYLVRCARNGALSVATVRETEGKGLIVHTVYKLSQPISEYSSTAKWWGPIELQK